MLTIVIIKYVIPFRWILCLNIIFRQENVIFMEKHQKILTT